MKRNRRPTRDDGRSFRPLFERYLEWITVHNFSLETVKTKRYQLERFEGWCKERDIDRPVEVTRALIERYQRSVFHFRQKNGRPLGRSTQNGYVSAVCVFFRWLKKRGYILSNPASDIELPKVDKLLPRHVLSATEVERVLHEIDIDERLGLRDRAIIEVLYSTGIRRAELLHLKLYDVDRDRGTLMIRLGKGKKDRIVPIGERALLWLEKYIEEWRPLYVCGKDDGEIFLGVRGKPLLELSLLRIVRKRLVAAELYKHGSGCHVFRHTAATLMLEGGADIRFIQQMLGHEHLNTTQIYTKVSIEKLKEVHARTHPARLHRETKVEDDGNNSVEHENKNGFKTSNNVGESALGEPNASVLR